MDGARARVRACVRAERPARVAFGRVPTYPVDGASVRDVCRVCAHVGAGHGYTMAAY